MNQEQEQEKIGYRARLAEKSSSLLDSATSAASTGWSRLTGFVKWVALLPFRFVGWVLSLLGALLKRVLFLLIIAGIGWSLYVNINELLTAGELAKANQIYKAAGPSAAFEFLSRYAWRDRRIKFELASFASEAGMETATENIYKDIIETQRVDPLGYYHFAMFRKKQGELREADDLLKHAHLTKVLSDAADNDMNLFEFLIGWGANAIDDDPVAFPEGYLSERLMDLAIDLLPDPLVAKALELPPLPRREEMQEERAWLLFRLGDTWESERIFRDLVKEHPGNPRYRGALGYQLAYEDSDLDEAISLLETAAKEEPEDPNILAALGWAQYRQSWIRDAGVNLEKALRSEQDQEQYDYVRTLAHYGEVRWEEGDQKEAVAVWREGWCQDDTHNVLQWTLRRYSIKFEEGDPRHRQTPRGAVICRVLDRSEEIEDAERHWRRDVIE